MDLKVYEACLFHDIASISLSKQADVILVRCVHEAVKSTSLYFGQCSTPSLITQSGSYLIGQAILLSLVEEIWEIEVQFSQL